MYLTSLQRALGTADSRYSHTWPIIKIENRMNERCVDDLTSLDGKGLWPARGRLPDKAEPQSGGRAGAGTAV